MYRRGILLGSTTSPATSDGGGGNGAGGGINQSTLNSDNSSSTGTKYRRRRKPITTPFGLIDISNIGSLIFLLLVIVLLFGLLMVVFLVLVDSTSTLLQHHHHSRHHLHGGGGGSGMMHHHNNNKPGSVPHPVPRNAAERKQEQEEKGDDSEEGDDGSDVLPWNPIYRIPESMTTVGDRSDYYTKLRQKVDPIVPMNPKRSRKLVEEMTTYTFQTYPMSVHNSDQVVYNVYDCPPVPPVGYPFSWKTMDLLENWPTDDVSPRPTIYQSLCVFDYQVDYDKAMTYRKAEKPFVVVNDPEVHRTVERWARPGYLNEMLGLVPHRTEYSENNHFMYYVPMPRKGNGGGFKRGPQVPNGWKPPTQNMRMPFTTWLQHANVSDDHLTRDSPHWYYRLIGCGTTGNDGSCDAGSSEYLFDELTFFQPKPNLYIVDPDEQKGIHCRFGMKGVIAENHFDGSRNSIALLGGTRRYIISDPWQCKNMCLYPKGHPSARHSSVDWSDPDLNHCPEFANARSSEIVMQPGQVLYLPTNWFHYIISLDLNFQCNTRSGIEDDLWEPIHQCGF